MSKPNLPRTILSVAACKFTRWILRRTGRGGTALPGRVALLLAPDILERVSEGMEILVVTGTNGKTTTCRMIEHALSVSGRSVLANRSGANLLSGVTAEMTCNATLTGKPKSPYAVIECDEGALKQVVPLIHPKVLVVTNLFRDQLDRYGEVTHTVNEVRAGIEKVPQTILCLNADDSLVASLAAGVPNPVVWYGLDTPAGPQKEAAVSDARYCIRCGAAYEYDYHTYAHLGGFRCPACGYARPSADFAVTKIEKITADGTRVRMRVPEDTAAPGQGGAAAAPPADAGERAHRRETQELAVTIGLPAVYNVYNAAAAVCAFAAFGLPAADAAASLPNVTSGFGRMETFRFGEKRENAVRMILVKNPAGCSQALSHVVSLEEDFHLILCLNDRTADGHDISWIWDADYEQLADNAHVRRILVSGDRAEDLQLRLKYAGIPEERISLEKDNGRLLAFLRESDLPVFILPNYTAMLSLRAVLAKASGTGAFWKG